MYKFQGNPMCEPCPLTVNKNCPDFSYLVPLKICYCCFTLGDVAVNWFIFVLPGIIYYVFMSLTEWTKSKIPKPRFQS